jgi:hypothetical protein
MQVPIACTLSAGDAADRTEEWRHFFATSIEAAVMEPEGPLHLKLSPSPEVLSAAVDLAQREIECCAFFDFSISIQADVSWLVMGVPPDAVRILEDFAALLPVGVRTGAQRHQDVGLTVSESYPDS